MNKQLELWRGDFGDNYTIRNRPTDEQLNARKQMWTGILNYLFTYEPIGSILEVGAGSGINIQAIDEVTALVVPKPKLYALEPNDKAYEVLKEQNIASGLFGGAADVSIIDSSEFDLVFTSGVLIHVHPSDLSKIMNNIYRISKKYVLCVEYFSPECREIKYRGQEGALWSNDFGGLYLNMGLQCLGYGFLWKRMTGLDDMTWTLFRKVN